MMKGHVLSISRQRSIARRLVPIVLCALLCVGLMPTVETHAKQKNEVRNGRIEIATNPGGYPILIDGQPAGETTASVRLIELPPGTHTVEIMFPNNRRWVREFNILPGRKECIVLSYTPRLVNIPRPSLSPCPYPVNVSAPATTNDGDLITFTADVDYQGSSPLNYTWSVSPSTARIVNGAGTRTITVDSTGLGQRQIIARLAVDDGSGDRRCRQEAQASTGVLVPTAPSVQPRRFDEFPSIAFDDDKARLDNLVIELQNNPNAVGYVIVYGGRQSRAGQADMLGARTRDYLVATRGIDASRLQIVNGGYRERASYELWVVPRGAQPPQPTPTVQQSDVMEPATGAPARRRRPRR